MKLILTGILCGLMAAISLVIGGFLSNDLITGVLVVVVSQAIGTVVIIKSVELW